MAKRKPIGDGTINHFNAVRLRVTGSGNLQMRLFSLDEVVEQDLIPLVLSATTDQMPTRLANFTQQKAGLEIKTTEIDETFRVSALIVFVKPVATSFPG